MPYGDSRNFITPWKRVEGFPASEIGDLTAGSTANVQTFMDARRNYKGIVSNITERDSLTGITTNDWVLVLSNANSLPEIDVWTGSQWVTISGSGGSGGSGTAIFGHFDELGPGDGTTTTFNLPAADLEEIVFLGRGYLCKRGTQAGGAASGDYYVSGPSIIFFQAPLAGVSVMVTYASPISGTVGGGSATNALTLTGFAPSITAPTSYSTVAVRSSTGALQAANPPSGAAGSGYVPVLDSTGKLPSSVLPSSTTSGYSTSIPTANSTIPVRNSSGVLFASQVSGLGTSAAATAVLVADSTGKLPAAALPTTINASTLATYSASATAAANTIALRNANGVLLASQHASLGQATAVGAVLVADAAGKLPATALPTTINATSLLTYVPSATAVASSIALRDANGRLVANQANGTSGFVLVADSNGLLPATALPTTINATTLENKTASDFVLAITPILKATMFAIGPLETFVDVGQIDYFIVPAAVTISKIQVSCPSTPLSGSVTVDVRKRSGAGSISTADTISLQTMTLTANSGLNFTSSSVTINLAANDVVIIKILSASAGFTDLRVELF